MQSHRLQILHQTLRQWLRARSTKEHPPQQIMQLQPQVQMMMAKVGVQYVENCIQRLGQIWALTLWGDQNKKEVEQQGWILVDKGSKLKRKSDQYYIGLSNAYSSLAEFSANPSQTMHQQAWPACSNSKQPNVGINGSGAKSKRNSTIQQTQMMQSLSNTSTGQMTNAQKWQRVTNPARTRLRLIQHTRHPPNQNCPCYSKART